MSDRPFLRYWTQFERWIEALSRAQRALAVGFIWFVVYLNVFLLIGKQQLWYSLVVAGLTAIGIGGFYYWWNL